MWHSTRREIQIWFDQNLQQFVEAENQNHGLTIDKWLENYVHDSPLEYFSVIFPSYYTSGWHISHTRRQISKEENQHPRPLN